MTEEPASPPRQRAVSRLRFLGAIVATSVAAVAFALEISPLISVASEAPVGLSTSFEARFEVGQPPAAPVEIVQRVVDFPVGARAARHLNGGPGHLTVLDGEIAMWIGDAPARTYSAGESFVEPFGVVAEAANQGTATARLLVTYLIPVGAAVSMREDASAPPAAQQMPTPALRFEARTQIDGAAPYSQVSHLLQTYQPGARTMSSEPPTTRLLTVVSGEVSVLTGPTQQTYTAGQHWTESPGQAWLSENLGSSPAVVAVSETTPLQ